MVNATVEEWPFAVTLQLPDGRRDHELLSVFERRQEWFAEQRGTQHTAGKDDQHR